MATTIDALFPVTETNWKPGGANSTIVEDSITEPGDYLVALVGGGAEIITVEIVDDGPVLYYQDMNEPWSGTWKHVLYFAKVSQVIKDLR